MSHDDQYKEFMEEVGKIHQQMVNHYIKEEQFKEEIRNKLDPMYELFINAQGFQNISRWVLMGLVKLALGVGVIYGFIKWLRQ